MVRLGKPLEQRINLQHSKKKKASRCVCQGYAALLLTGKFLLQCLSAAVYLQICSAVEVQSSPLSKDLKDFLQTLQDVLKYLSKTELRVFGYSSLFVESLMVFGKTFY